MSCLLCLEVTESYKNLIVFNSSEWQELNMQYIIEKHLWKLEVLNSQSYICQACWKELYNFHKFYSKLEKARSNLNDLLITQKVIKEAVETGNEEAEKISNIAKVSEPEPEILFFRDGYPTDIFETEDEEEVSYIKTNSQHKCSENISLHDKEIVKNSSGKTSNKEQSSNAEINELKSSENPDGIGSKFEVRVERIENDKSDENGAEINSELKPIENDAEENKMENQESICLKRSTKRKYSRKKSTNDNKVITRKSLRQRASKDKSNIETEIRNLKSDKSRDEIGKMLEVERIEKDAKENSMKFDENIDELKTKLELKTTQNDAKQNKMEEDDENDSSTNDDVTSSDAADSGKLHKLSAKDKLIAKNVQITCDICKIPQDTFSAVIKHYKDIHNQRGYVKCCGNKFANRFELMDHINFHKNPEDFKCKQCDKVFHKIAALKVHIKEVHEAEVAECDVCGKSYTNERGLKKHKKLHKTEDISCEKCGKSYSSKYSLHNHMRVIHLKNIICHLCGKSVILPELKRHMARHEGKKPPRLSCKICDRQFAHKCGLNRHVQDKHPPKGANAEFKCDKCPKVFPCASSLKTHIRQVHETALVRKCVLCDKTVKGSVALREHISRHKGEPLYNCSLCSRQFYSNSNLHTHRKTCSANRKEKRVKKRTEDE